MDNRKQKYRSLMISIAVLATVSVLTGCTLPFAFPPKSTTTSSDIADTDPSTNTSSATPSAIELTSSGLMITWEYAAIASSFALSYADAKTAGAPWTSLATVSASGDLAYDIAYEALPVGEWIIGITALDESGNCSDRHTSLASDSIPTTGWIIKKN